MTAFVPLLLVRRSALQRQHCYQLGCLTTLWMLMSLLVLGHEWVDKAHLDKNHRMRTTLSLPDLQGGLSVLCLVHMDLLSIYHIRLLGVKIATVDPSGALALEVISALLHPQLLSNPNQLADEHSFLGFIEDQSRLRSLSLQP